VVLVKSLLIEIAVSGPDSSANVASEKPSIATQIETAPKQVAN